MAAARRAAAICATQVPIGTSGPDGRGSIVIGEGDLNLRTKRHSQDIPDHRRGMPPGGGGFVGAG